MKKTRFVWLTCILAMHAAIGLTMGMYLFAFVMIVLNLAAFGVGSGVRFLRHRQQFEAVVPGKQLSP
jgi:hypothetical protein